MAACDYCGATILWGGTRAGDFVFCNATCQSEGILVTLIDHIPPEITQPQLELVHQGTCPNCGGAGPVDVHTSHYVTSALIMTWWNSRPKVCCRWCGAKGQLGGLVWSSVAGWWGFPWGIIMTPIQVIRNLCGLIFPPNSAEPTVQLRKMVNLNLAAQLHDRLSQLPANHELQTLDDADE